MNLYYLFHLNYIEPCIYHTFTSSGNHKVLILMNLTDIKTLNRYK